MDLSDIFGKLMEVVNPGKLKTFPYLYPAYPCRHCGFTRSAECSKDGSRCYKYDHYTTSVEEINKHMILLNYDFQQRAVKKYNFLHYFVITQGMYFVPKNSETEWVVKFNAAHIAFFNEVEKLIIPLLSKKKINLKLIKVSLVLARVLDYNNNIIFSKNT